MNTVRFLLVAIMGVILVQGTGFGSQPNQAAVKTSSTREAAVSRSITKRRPSEGPRKLPLNHQVRRAAVTAANNLPAPAPADDLDLHQTRPSRSTGVARPPASHRSLPLPRPAVGTNGQSFTNSRNPRARLATSGGPASSARGTVAINGTNMKLKP
jgi:hypothetical protein